MHLRLFFRRFARGRTFREGAHATNVPERFAVTLTIPFAAFLTFGKNLRQQTSYVKTIFQKNFD
jgi:hypothetical protein